MSSLKALEDSGFGFVALGIFDRQRAFAEHCLGQIIDADFFARPVEGFNSCAIIVRHMAGNMRSR